MKETGELILFKKFRSTF